MARGPGPGPAVAGRSLAPAKARDAKILALLSESESGPLSTSPRGLGRTRAEPSTHNSEPTSKTHFNKFA